MADDAAYSAVRVLAKACAIVVAATAPPIWLFSQLTPYHFLFSAPATFGSFGNLINVCAFTGFLFAAGGLPTSILYLYIVKDESDKSWDKGVLGTLMIVAIAAIYFFLGLRGLRPPKTAIFVMGSLILLPVLIRWTKPLRRFFRAHILLFVPIAYAIGICFVVLTAFDLAVPDLAPKHFIDNVGRSYTYYLPPDFDDTSFYVAKSISEFGFWDWLAAVGGALVYVAAVIIWGNLTKPSTAGSNRQVADANPTEKV